MQDFEQRSLALTDMDSDCLNGGLLSLVDGGEAAELRLRPEMRSERCREQTFKNWAADCAAKLASYGFYLSAGGDCIRCAFCGLEIHTFTSPNEVRVLHWKAAHKECPFLRGEDVANASGQPEVTLVENLTAEREKVGHDVRRSTQRSTTRSRELPGQTTHCHTTHNHTCVNSSPVWHSSVMSLANASIPAATPSKQKDPNTSQQRQSSHRPKSQEKTASGDQRHQRPRKTANKPQLIPPSQVAATPVTGLWADIVLTAKYPQMAAYQDRLETLSRWPLVRPTPKELARAGLFHTKHLSSLIPEDHNRRHIHKSEDAYCYPDSAMCFWCGQKIYRWQKTDDALLEHARLSPQCRYVIQLLGPQLHSDVISATYTEQVENSERWTTRTNENMLQPFFTQDHRQSVSVLPPPSPSSTLTSRPQQHQNQQQQQIDDIMESPEIQRVLQMGFTRPIVRALLCLHHPRITPEILCEVAQKAAEEQWRT